jgi:hypothetical protein
MNRALPPRDRGSRSRPSLWSSLAEDDFGQLGVSQRYLDDVDAEERGFRVGFRVAAGAAREYGVLVIAPAFEPFRGERISIKQGGDAALTVQLQIQRQTSSVTDSLSATAVSVDPTQNAGQIVLRGSDLDSFPTIPTTWRMSCKCWLDQVPAWAGSLRGLAESDPRRILTIPRIRTSTTNPRRIEPFAPTTGAAHARAAVRASD